MKLTIAALFILMAVAVVQQIASAGAIDFNVHPASADSDAKKIESRMADALRGLASAPVSRAASMKGIEDEANQKADESSINSSAFNQSLNTSALNSSAFNSSVFNSSVLNGSAESDGSGASMISSSTEASPQKMGTSSKGASRGFWGIQASQHVMGQSDIKSKMFLSGNFDVDKTVQFTDRGN